MPGRLFLTRPLREIAEWMGAEDKNLPQQPPRFNIAPGQNIAVCVEGQLREMRWGIIPVGRKNARGRPVMETIINARSETVLDKSAFDGVKRCLVPADGWYEWTGEKRLKTAWRIKNKDGSPLAFAAIFDIWTAPGGLEVPQVATVTCEPNNDVREIHHRMGVLLEPAQFATWLGADDTAASRLMVPYPEGRLSIEEVTDVDWNGA